MFLAKSRALIIFTVCFTLPLGNFFGIPVLATGIRRYTNSKSRSFAFGLFYIILNIAALIAGPVVDAFTIWFKQGDTTSTPGEWSLTPYRAIILTGVVANGLALIISLFVREIKLEEPNTSVSSSSVSMSAYTPAKSSILDIYREVIDSKNFWRFLAVCLITLNVRMVFRHLDATFPKYMVREFGEDVPKGTIYSINPAIVIMLVPIVSAATSHIDPLTMIHFGSYLSAASVFFLVGSTSIWASILFIVVLSIGESIWSPRLYDYTMSVCTEGREGTFMAFASAPLFVAKLPVGFMSGWLLELYCPAIGKRNSPMMWLIIGLFTIVSPILMTLFWGYISNTEDNVSQTRAELEQLELTENEEEPKKTSLSSVV